MGPDGNAEMQSRAAVSGNAAMRQSWVHASRLLFLALNSVGRVPVFEAGCRMFNSFSAIFLLCYDEVILAKKGGNPQNLKTLTSEEARKVGADGGKKSGVVRRERKLLSQIYGELLGKDFDVDGEKLTIAEVVAKVLARNDSASVSMLKEIREATEGNKTELSGSIATPVLNIVVENADKP